MDTRGVGRRCLPRDRGIDGLNKDGGGDPDPHGLLGTKADGLRRVDMIAVIVCLGLPVLVAQPHPSRWIWLFPALGGGLMGACLFSRPRTGRQTLLGEVCWASECSP